MISSLSLIVVIGLLSLPKSGKNVAMKNQEHSFAVLKSVLPQNFRTIHLVYVLFVKGKTYVSRSSSCYNPCNICASAFVVVVAITSSIQTLLVLIYFICR